MPGTVKMTLPDGREVDGVQVEVKESTERWSEFTFDDGTRMRIKITILGATRALEGYDPAGVPWYQLNMVPIFSPMEVPEHLKKKEK